MRQQLTVQWRVSPDQALPLPKMQLPFSMKSTGPKRGGCGPQRKFSPEEDRQILDMRRQGHTWKAIAEAIPERGKHNVLYRHRNFLRSVEEGRAPYPYRISYSTKQKELIVDSRASRETWQTISERLGLPLNTVYTHGIQLFKEERWRSRYLQRLDPTISARKPAYGKAWTAEEDELVRQMRCAGATWHKIAMTMGRTFVMVQNRWLEWLDDGPLARMNRSREVQARGTVNKPLTTDNRERLSRMIASGESSYNIALALELSISEVLRRKRDHRRSELLGNAPRPKKLRWSEAEDHVLRSAVERQLCGPDLWNLLPQRTCLSINCRCHKLRLDISYGAHTYIRNQLWTTSEDDTLVRLRADGKTYKQIGLSLGRTAIACARRYGRLEQKLA